MRGKITTLFLAFAVLWTWTSCDRGRTQSALEPADTLSLEDTLDIDTIGFFPEEDEGLSLDNHESEVFGDFIFAFTHNGRFQAERIRFPLPVTDFDGTERVIRSGRQFRDEFQLPGNDYYTLILGDRSQMDIFQNDSSLTDVALQSLDLPNQTMVSYNFTRTDGRWYLTSRTHTPLSPKLTDFLQFYDQFTTDTLFQQESIAEQLIFTMEDPDEEEGEDIQGTIDRGQWPVFRPEMPSGRFVNIDFGQPIPNPHRIHLLQCGISNGMLDIFTFHQHDGHWQLISFEN
ncbi:MAG: DUF4348 domain-containing protein [Bacteroidaceae bacterium]|nr:DUF4348 domain-containing protein [Bacteroidaceae bacterium]